VLSLGGLELGARLFLAPFPPNQLPSAADQRLFLPPSSAPDRPFVASNLGWNNRACTSVFANHFPEQHRDELAEAARASRHVLHVGDSMIETGDDSAAGRTPRVTELLRTRVPDSAHVNVGNADTGPDAYYLAVRAWMKLLRLDLVVVYFYC
jgi:hypothetical protein